jgi:hypothetical protein
LRSMELFKPCTECHELGLFSVDELYFRGILRFIEMTLFILIPARTWDEFVRRDLIVGFLCRSYLKKL